MKKRIAVYNNQQPDGPYHVIILDWEWWREDWSKISEWFDQNAPHLKPQPEDTMFKFESYDQYTLWRIVWDTY